MEGGKGRLVVIMGPMFAGKTSRLIELLERELIAGRSIALHKARVDHRYSETDVVTHKGIRLPAKAVETDRSGVLEIVESAKGAQVIGVDEAQFWPLDANLPAALEELTFQGKIVIASVLNRDHHGEPFGGAMELLARADEIQSLSAVCRRCGEDAYFTQRMLGDREVFGQQVQVGGSELYEPRCRTCFVRPPA